MLHKWKVLGQPTFSLEYPCQRLRIAEGGRHPRYKRGRVEYA